MLGKGIGIVVTGVLRQGKGGSSSPPPLPLRWETAVRSPIGMLRHQPTLRLLALRGHPRRTFPSSSSSCSLCDGHCRSRSRDGSLDMSSTQYTAVSSQGGVARSSGMGGTYLQPTAAAAMGTAPPRRGASPTPQMRKGVSGASYDPNPLPASTTGFGVRGSSPLRVVGSAQGIGSGFDTSSRPSSARAGTPTRTVNQPVWR